MSRFRRASSAAAFTLVELLVVIGIIAVLIGILLPVLGKAREQANSVKCAANLNSVGKGISIYLAEFKGTYPPAYVYTVDPSNGAPDAGGGTAADPIRGYYHWSWFIYSSGRKQSVPENAFTCPSLMEGGLPPTNPKRGDEMPGQQRDPETAAGVEDQQVRRLAYTVNEAIMPRNKFNAKIRGSGSGGFVNQYVRASQVRQAGHTILATEFTQDYKVISESQAADDGVVKSHRPVHGFIPRNANSLNLTDATPRISGVGGSGPGFADFDRVQSVSYPANSTESRLAWVGRNHGKGKPAKTNFLYCDGHVETKTIEETLKPIFQWGDRVYSMAPQSSVAK